MGEHTCHIGAGEMEEIFSQLTGAWISNTVSKHLLEKECYPWAIIAAYYASLASTRALILFERISINQRKFRTHKGTWNYLSSRFKTLEKVFKNKADMLINALRETGLAAYNLRIDMNYLWLIGAHTHEGLASEKVDVASLAKDMYKFSCLLIKIVEEGIIKFLLKIKPEKWKLHLKHFKQEWDSFTKSSKLPIPEEHVTHIKQLLKQCEIFKFDKNEWRSYYRETFEFQKKEMHIKEFGKHVKKFQQKLKKLLKIV